MDWIKDIKVLIFDMDGTLYQEDTFLGRYLRYMLENQYSNQQIEGVIQEAYDILHGNHSVSLGHYYDLTTRTIYTHKNLIPASAYNWKGQKLAQEYDGKSRLFYIGDPWEIAGLFGEMLGVSEIIRINAFNRVRAEMLTSPYFIPKSEKLIQVLRNVDVESKILITNSPFESGEVFLDYLELLPYFDMKIYDGKKPKGTELIIYKLTKKGYKPEEILSIGDNPKNDLHPARQIGARTLFISNYHNVDKTVWNCKVKNVDELIAFLQQFPTKGS